MNSSFFQQDNIVCHDSFLSPPQTEQFQGYYTTLHNLDSALLHLSMDNKFNSHFYPSPTESPLANDILMVTANPDYQQDMFHAINYNGQDIMDMVPPLEYNIPMDPYSSLIDENDFYDYHIPDIDFVDQFIAQHEAVLNFPEQQSQQYQELLQDEPEEELKEVQQQEQQKVTIKETSWSHWTFSRGASPELTCEPTDLMNESAIFINEKSPVKTKKVIKKTQSGPRRGRGKGVKNAQKSTPAIKKITAPKTPLEGALYVCQHNGCGRSFTRPYNLTSHMRTHTSERPYACSHCGRRFARQHDRNRHEKLHWGIRPYACDNCHKSFARMDALNRHLRMENGCTGMHV
ncbi:hypothetical protein BDB01DRAFT_776137 [Pilobolus umbonatus]|nr:hypothetical protein BDB01DRAFT_776137 [Pilobolus umbonatus]